MVQPNYDWPLLHWQLCLLIFHPSLSEEASGRRKFGEMLGLHHSQVASIDQRKSFPVLSQSLGCIVRANILFSRFLCSHLWQLAIILVQPEDIGCSSRFMDFWICCREIFSRHWISVAERNISGEIFSGSVAQEYFLVTHQFPRTRNIFTPIWAL